MIFRLSSSVSLHWPDTIYDDRFAERKLPTDGAEARVAILVGAVLGLLVTKEAGRIQHSANRVVTGTRTQEKDEPPWVPAEVPLKRSSTLQVASFRGVGQLWEHFIPAGQLGHLLGTPPVKALLEAGFNRLCQECRRMEAGKKDEVGPLVIELQRTGNALRRHNDLRRGAQMACLLQQTPVIRAFKDRIGNGGDHQLSAMNRRVVQRLHVRDIPVGARYTTPLQFRMDFGVEIDHQHIIQQMVPPVFQLPELKLVQHRTGLAVKPQEDDALPRAPACALLRITLVAEIAHA